MICDAATKPGETCHPLRAYGKYTMNPDPQYEHKNRNLHGWPPHKNNGEPPMNSVDCVKAGGIWAPHVIYDRSSRLTEGTPERKVILPDACASSPYAGKYKTKKGPDDKLKCRAAGGSWAKIDSSPATCGTACKFECRMPCCLAIFEDGPPMYKEREVDKFPSGKNDIAVNAAEDENIELYEFLGKRPVCSRANPCEPKFSCLGGDMCLEGYVKYYEPYVKKDDEYVCQNFHYALPGKCPSPIATWGPMSGFSEFDKDFQKRKIPNFHAFLISSAFDSSSGGRRLESNATSDKNAIEGSFDFQSINPKTKNYRAKWCDDFDNDQHCFWGTPVKVLGFADGPNDAPSLIDSDQWQVLSKEKIEKMKFESNSTRSSLLDATRIVKVLTPEAPKTTVKVQMYDKTFKLVSADLLVLITYPSLRLSGVPDSIDPEGGNAEWCREHPARCYWERNPHPKGEYDKQKQFRPQSQMCCYAPKCTECDPATHFRMNENCVGCPKCWWCIPLAITCACLFGGIATHYLMKMRLNFVIISLAFDHMQILGLLAGAKINWPWQIAIILKWFVFFQLDVDVAGPECLARGLVTFENKWWFKVLLPFIGMATVAVVKTITAVICCCHHHKKHKKKKIIIKKSGLGEDLAHNGQSTKTITFMVKSFINIVAFCCT
jgi:hypothetical protein